MAEHGNDFIVTGQISKEQKLNGTRVGADLNKQRYVILLVGGHKSRISAFFPCPRVGIYNVTARFTGSRQLTSGVNVVGLELRIGSLTRVITIGNHYRYVVPAYVSYSTGGAALG